MLKTKAGLVPTEKELPYVITTEMAEEFLQKKFDFVVNAINNSDGNGFQPDINVTLVSVRCSRKFTPFMLVLPLSVLMEKQKRNDNELSLFNPEGRENIARLKKPFYETVSPYIYNKNDENSFFSNTCRNALGVTMKGSYWLKAHRVPKIQSFNKRNEYVMGLIDPIRLFHDMLQNTENKEEKFSVNIGNTTLIKDGNYRYEVYRTINDKKDKGKTFDLEKLIVNELNKNLR